MKFSDWINKHGFAFIADDEIRGVGISSAKLAWDYQQEKIDELEEELETYSVRLRKAAGFIEMMDKFEAKNKKLKELIKRHCTELPVGHNKLLLKQLQELEK